MPPSPFACGREIAIEFKSGNRYGKIWVIQPDGDMKLQYTYHTANKLAESQLKQISDAEDKVEQLHITKRKDRDFNFFERIFLRCEGYSIEGKNLSSLSRQDQLEQLEKWHPEHIEALVYEVFDREIGELKHKKKD